MASSLISNSHHIDFDSIFDMDDAGLAQVFETLIATGLRNFLGCPAVFYEAAVTEFFTNGSVREDGMVVRTIRGTTVEISESFFATAFDLPTETLFVKAGSFDAVTRDRFLLMTAITFDVKVNWSNLLFGVLQAMGNQRFPKSRILDAKTVHRFVHINEKVGLDESAASPRVKRTPVKKAVFKKRPALGVEDAPVVKKKRTTKGKPVVIAQEAVPLQIDDATTDAPVEQLSVPKRKSQKRKRKLVLEDDVEIDEPFPAYVEQPAVVPVVEGVTADTDSLAVRKRFNVLDAKIILLDGQVAAIRSEQLEFQEKMAADFLSLSTQIGDVVDYIRGGDTKKGEGSSSRRPLPTPINQGESSGNVIRTTEIISQTDIDAAQRDIMERMMRADRERDRERRERRLSRSGSYKRRRGY
ncbi:hypothetical protein F511_26460 [Dorcoceras hygrometricum]|uniref:Uncharacterized protein n=1 Tax=Dorcoceras hygrometricum TaxID=472368 RepID=A0A2Z7CZK1_9LAMI|nr:hypothetical protein F511_26460 [Dorcoceras hygrometricum]